MVHDRNGPRTVVVVERVHTLWWMTDQQLFTSCCVLLCFFLPPLAVFLDRGCTVDLALNFCLWLLGWIPGTIHALFVVFTHPSPLTPSADGHTHWDPEAAASGPSSSSDEDEKTKRYRGRSLERAPTYWSTRTAPPVYSSKRFQLLRASSTPRLPSAALRRSLGSSSTPSSALHDLFGWHSKRRRRKVEVHISSPERGSEMWRASVAARRGVDERDGAEEVRESAMRRHLDEALKIAKGSAFPAMGEKTSKKK